jgi:hypothetical protein
MDVEANVRSILIELRARAEAGGDGAIYGDRNSALHDIDILLANLSLNQVKVLLAPTANLQELSIECGWGSEFNELAAKLENLLDIA